MRGQFRLALVLSFLQLRVLECSKASVPLSSALHPGLSLFSSALHHSSMRGSPAHLRAFLFAAHLLSLTPLNLPDSNILFSGFAVHGSSSQLSLGATNSPLVTRSLSLTPSSLCGSFFTLALLHNSSFFHPDPSFSPSVASFCGHIYYESGINRKSHIHQRTQHVSVLHVRWKEQQDDT